MLITNILLGLLLLGIATVIWLQTRPNVDPDSLNKDDLTALQKDIAESRLADREHFQKTMQSQFRQSTDIISKVTEKLTKLDETNKRVVGFSEQLQDLQNILQTPKGRGILGESWLETMLAHVLQPNQYKMQHKFSNGEIVDAAIYFQDKIIPIDAKFSLDNYNDMVNEKDPEIRSKLETNFKKNLKVRIDETSKYIRPEENTTDYAFMFIPAEGVYYDLLVNTVGATDINRENLVQYAHGKRVFIVSPNTFFAFLQTVLAGIRAYQMQENAQDILKHVEKLGKHINSYESYMQKVGNNLGTTVNMFNQAYNEFKKIDKDVYKLTDGSVGGTADPMLLDKPSAHSDDQISRTSSKRSSPTLVG